MTFLLPGGIGQLQEAIWCDFSYAIQAQVRRPESIVGDTKVLGRCKAGQRGNHKQYKLDQNQHGQLMADTSFKFSPKSDNGFKYILCLSVRYQQY